MPDQDAGRRTPTKRRAYRLISPITRRILLVNLMVLALLVVSLLSLGAYRRNLIETELLGLTSHAQMFAAALAEGAVAADVPAARGFVRDTARQMLLRLVDTSGARARLFTPSGEVLIDSRHLGSANRSVAVEELAPPGTNPLETLKSFYNDILIRLPGGIDRPPPYQEQLVQRAHQYAEVMEALTGDNGRMVRTLDEGRLAFSVAVPVQRYKRVLGAVMLTKDSTGVDRAMAEVRLNILKISAFALALTIMLSIYLASTISRPLNRLVTAADLVRHGRHRQYHIPDLSVRNDEIGDLSESLREMTESLRNRLDAIESFAADVAHEIKNPLTSLRSAVETTQRLKDPQAREKLLEVIGEDVTRLDRLISDISDASRLDAELSRSDYEWVDLGAMLQALSDVHTTTRKPEDPHLAFSPPRGLPIRAHGIERRLVQVLRNLIANAVTFSPPVGVITLNVTTAAGKAVITVDDQGPGLPEGKEEAIFERFYTERPKTEAFGSHSGLGLSISRQIVEAHGGTLTAENLRDTNDQTRGARFTITLPIR